MPTISATPLTAAYLSAVVWGGAAWLAWPSDRLRPAVLVAAAVWVAIYTLRTVRG